MDATMDGALSSLAILTVVQSHIHTAHSRLGRHTVL